MKAIELLRPSLRALSAYQAEEPKGSIVLDANENPYAPPAAFLGRIAQGLGALALNRYPDPHCARLLAAAGRYYGVGPASLLPGNGSDEFIASLFVAFGGEGRRCLIARPTFSMYALCAKASGWELLEEDLGGGFELTAAFVARARRDRPDMVLLASPNNPTGLRCDDTLVDELLGLGCLVVLDEAYAEFAPKNRSADAAGRENLISLRTLSKAFGLAGLRLGFLAARPELVAELNKARLPYNIDVAAQAWGALALEMSAEFLPALGRIMADKPRLAAGLAEIPGLELFGSDANFFFFRHAQAGALHAHLMSQGIRIRRFRGGRLENCMRITVGSTVEVDRCLAAFKDWKP